MSRLIPLGIALILSGIFLANPLEDGASATAPGTLRSVAFIFTDVLRVGFFAGIACAIIGWLRDRKK